MSVVGNIKASMGEFVDKVLHGNERDNSRPKQAIVCSSARNFELKHPNSKLYFFVSCVDDLKDYRGTVYVEGFYQRNPEWKKINLFLKENGKSGRIRVARM